MANTRLVLESLRDQGDDALGPLLELETLFDLEKPQFGKRVKYEAKSVNVLSGLQKTSKSTLFQNEYGVTLGGVNENEQVFTLASLL